MFFYFILYKIIKRLVAFSLTEETTFSMFLLSIFETHVLYPRLLRSYRTDFTFHS